MDRREDRLLVKSIDRWTRMRTVALLLLLAAPALVVAQTTPTTEGTINTSGSYINLAQCNGTDPATVEPLLGLSNDLGLRWLVKMDGTAFDTSGKFQPWAANQQPSTNGTSGLVTCSQPPSGATGFVSNSLEAAFDAPLQNTASTHSYAMRDVVTKAGFDCSQDGKTIYLCANWLQNGTTPHGWATGTVTLDLTPPASAPTNLHLTAGDGVLHVNCDGNSDIVSFKAKATAAEESQPHYSNKASSCGDVVITGLVNSRTYTVVVYGMDVADNPSGPSASQDMAPVPTDDFWTHYKDAGGREQGGCSTSGAAGLLGLLSLLALRRRRP